MAFKVIDQQLIDECCKDIADLDKITSLIVDGADINAFDEEYEQELYNSVLDYYISEEKADLRNLFIITELFLNNNFILNPKPDDYFYFIPKRFIFLPPEKICVDIFKLILEKGDFSFNDLNGMISDCCLDLHLNEFYFYKETQYSKQDSLNYYLELIYWACAYKVKLFSEECSKDILDFDWFNREKNKVELIYENRSSSVFIEDSETHNRTEIEGWTTKY